VVWHHITGDNFFQICKTRPFGAVLHTPKSGHHVREPLGNLYPPCTTTSPHTCHVGGHHEVPRTLRYPCAQGQDLSLHHQRLSFDGILCGIQCVHTQPPPTHMGLNLSTLHPKISTPHAHGVGTRGAMLQSGHLDTPRPPCGALTFQITLSLHGSATCFCYSTTKTLSTTPKT
jgi:hypothetical protein